LLAWLLLSAQSSKIFWKVKFSQKN